MARRRSRTTYGKTFRTKSGRLGRYVYKNGKRVGFKAVKFTFRNAKRGAGRYISYRTNKSLRRKFG